jgi:hypothetical protein
LNLFQQQFARFHTDILCRFIVSYIPAVVLHIVQPFLRFLHINCRYFDPVCPSGSTIALNRSTVVVVSPVYLKYKRHDCADMLHRGIRTSNVAEANTSRRVRICLVATCTRRASYCVHPCCTRIVDQPVPVLCSSHINMGEKATQCPLHFELGTCMSIACV